MKRPETHCARSSGLVALRAEGLRTLEHGLAGLVNGMVAVTNDAAAAARRSGKDRLVNALCIELAEQHVLSE